MLYCLLANRAKRKGRFALKSLIEVQVLLSYFTELFA